MTQYGWLLSFLDHYNAITFVALKKKECLSWSWLASPVSVHHNLTLALLFLWTFTHLFYHIISYHGLILLQCNKIFTIVGRKCNWKVLTLQVFYSIFLVISFSYSVNISIIISISGLDIPLLLSNLTTLSLKIITVRSLLSWTYLTIN